MQLKLAMNKEIQINELACYYNLCVEWKKKKSKCTISDLTAHTMCESTTLLVMFYYKIKQLWKQNLKDPTNHSNISSSPGNLQHMGK